MTPYLHGIAYAVPERVQTNEELVAGVPGWSAEKILLRTGMRARRVTGPGETASDLCVRAAEQLFAERSVDPNSIDCLIFCTQSPDYFIPATACLLQDRLGLPTTCAAFDINQGCSGFVYGLMLCRALIVSGSARRVLLLNGETYSKMLNPRDIPTSCLLADGGAATLVSCEREGAWAEIGESRLGTNGRGAKNLYMPAGAFRQLDATEESPRYIYMNGAEIAAFAVGTITAGIQRLLDVVGRDWPEIDWFLFHQANPGFVKRVATALKLPLDKVPIDLDEFGNTGGSTIPILMRRMYERDQFRAGQKCVMAGFGTGYSWGMTYAEWLGG